MSKNTGATGCNISANQRSGIRKFFDSCPNSASIDVYDNELFTGMELSWSLAGNGFGQFNFYVDKKKKEFFIDNECSRPETIKRAIDVLIDKNPESLREMFYKMIDNSKLIDKIKKK